MNWQITATTIYCDAVDDEVTLLLYKDGTVTCTGYKKYGESSRAISNRMKKKSKQLKRQLKCEGPECYRVTQYKDRLFTEKTLDKSLSIPQNGVQQGE